MDIASIAAARKMHQYLIQMTDLTDAQAAMLLSLIGDLRISQAIRKRDVL